MNSAPGEPFVFWMERPRRVRAIPLFFIGFIAACMGYLVAGVGFDDLVAGFRAQPALWLLALVLAAVVALMVRYAFPARGSQPRLEIGRESFRLVPSLVMRRWFGEPISEIAIPQNAREIVLCDRFLQEVPDGFWIIVRSADDAEREIGFGSFALLARRRAVELQQGIENATGLPVRLAIRRRQADGTVVESVWPANRSRARGYLASVTGVLPFAGGIVVGYFLPRPAVIVAVGAALWAAGMVAIYASARARHDTKNFPTAYLLSSLFTFAASYGVAIVIVGYMFRAH